MKQSPPTAIHFSVAVIWLLFLTRQWVFPRQPHLMSVKPAREAISTCPRKFCSTTLLHTIAFAALPCLMQPLFYPSIFLTLFLPTQFLTTAVYINRYWVDPYPLTLKQILQAKCRKSGFLMTKIKVKDHMYWCSRRTHTHTQALHKLCSNTVEKRWRKDLN